MRSKRSNSRSIKKFSFCTSPGLAWLLAVALLTAVTPAQAQESIGIAVTIRNDVNGTVASRTFPINAGETVFRQEVVSTGPDSSAKLVFADSTNLSVGPDSTVTLDKFVYAGANDYKKATVQLVKGVFRFTTGNSDRRAYEIKTDVATIGVRGTVVDIKPDPGRTIVVLQQGRVIACSTSYHCTVLSKPGETAVITATSATNEGVGGGGGWSFASLCASDLSLCEVTTLASSQPPASPNYNVTTRATTQPTVSTASTSQPQVTTSVSQPSVTTLASTQPPVSSPAAEALGNEYLVFGAVTTVGVTGVITVEVANTLAQNPSKPASP